MHDLQVFGVSREASVYILQAEFLSSNFTLFECFVVLRGNTEKIHYMAFFRHLFMWKYLLNVSSYSKCYDCSSELDRVYAS